MCQEVEKQHLDQEKRIQDVKGAAGQVLALGVTPQTSVEISSRVEAAIVAYNTVCAELLGKLYPINCFTSVADPDPKLKDPDPK